MKRILLIGGVVLLAASVGFVVQTFDLAGSVDSFVSLAALKNHANAADSGVRVDRAGYACATWEINTGIADNGTATGNVVVSLDSIPGTAAWQLNDSVTVDTVDNKNYELAYRGTRRWVRLLARASGQAADTFGINGVLIQGCKRAR